MKGKGKGDRTGGKGEKGEKSGGGKLSEKERKANEKDKEKEDWANCPLQFPDLTPVDHTRSCLRYTAILSRDESDTVGIEEVDSLQTDLETLLSSVAKRMRILETEMQVLNQLQDGKIIPSKDQASTPKGKGSGKGVGDHGSAKRSGKGGDDKPAKKFKESSGKGSIVKGTPKGKVQQVKSIQEYEFPESPANKPPPPPLPLPPPPPAPEVPKLKTDVPNRFWALVEPYVSDISNDNLKVLEDLIRGYEDDSEYYKIPPLGKQYAEKWAQEDMLEEQREAGKLVGDKRRLSSDVAAMMKKDDDTSPFGPLTQRLVQALIEENIMTPLDDSSISEADAAEAASISPRSLAKQLNIGNTAALERRIKRELEENGILEPEDFADEAPEDDEIVTELQKKQQELKVLSAHNLLMTKRLYKHAKDELAWQEQKKKVAAADNEVMEAYRKIQAIRAKKKSPTKKELEAAKKVLRDRETLVRQLESWNK